LGVQPIIYYTIVRLITLNGLPSSVMTHILYEFYDIMLMTDCSYLIT